MSILDNIDFDEIEEELAEIIIDALDELVDGAQADLEEFGKVIAMELVFAIKSDDDEAIRELLAQTRALAEINRLRLNRKARVVLNRVLAVAARVGKSLLTAAMAAV